ncbi:MAG TPA: aminoglycoside 3'-phosphotransferase [Euzebyales bacterium]|nr:aminoglycoside 3'-phosphotransferase [Euzebyales bacterium]
MRPAPTEAQLPARARRYLARGDAELIYNPYDTATWRVRVAGAPWLYLKAGPVGHHPSLQDERDRLLWLAARGAAVPEVVDMGAGGDVEWMVTVALPGLPATAPEHLERPRRTVPILAEALRAFHEIDPTGCPFEWTVKHALAHVEQRVAAAAIDVAGFHDEHRHLSPEDALARVRATAPPDDDLVVTHGDWCFPNIMIAGVRAVGVLDVGEAGLAHRWRDLAVGTWATTWNVGPGYEDLFLDAYGTDWDLDRAAFYRLLSDLES